MTDFICYRKNEDTKQWKPDIHSCDNESDYNICNDKCVKRNRTDTCAEADDGYKERDHVENEITDTTGYDNGKDCINNSCHDICSTDANDKEQQPLNKYCPDSGEDVCKSDDKIKNTDSSARRGSFVSVDITSDKESNEEVCADTFIGDKACSIFCNASCGKVKECVNISCSLSRDQGKACGNSFCSASFDKGTKCGCRFFF